MSWTRLYLITPFYPFGIIFLGIFHLGLPIYVDIILSAVLFYYLRNIFASSVITLLLVTVFVLLNIFYEVDGLYYRPHDRFQTMNSAYEPNVNVLWPMPFGDLFATSGEKLDTKEIIEPRLVEFVTDRYGYRNSSSAKSFDYALVGDSFIVGNGTTQSEILSNQLEGITKLNFLNLGYPNGPEKYEAVAKRNMHRIKGETKIFLFYFEGNDFNKKSLKQDKIKKFDLFKNAILDLEKRKTQYLIKLFPKSMSFIRAVRRNSLYTYTLVSQMVFGIKGQNHNNIIVQKIGDKNIAYLPAYVEIAKSDNLRTYGWKDRELLKHLGGVFFIPTKYRVYNTIISNPGLAALRRVYRDNCTPVYDLTPTLVESANHELKSGKYIFWRDDTHWNAVGIKAAANFIATTIETSQKQKSDCLG